MNLLIADDEKEIVRFLKLYLEKDHYTVFEAYDGKQALEIVEREDISLALLDIMMPEMDGFHLLKEIRKNHNFPILMITAKSESENMVLGLGLGADDYITKPFNPIEVCARVDANLRRFYELGNAPSPAQSVTQIQLHDLLLDTKECRLYRCPQENGQPSEIELTSMEYKILRLFMENPGKVFTKQEIFEHVWQDTYVADDNNIMSYISRIRDKLPGRDYIKTIRGLGYRFERPVIKKQKSRDEL